MKKILLIIVLLITFICFGCYDYSDTSKTLLISSIGVDYKDGKYTYYFHLVNPNTLTTTELGGGQEESSFSVAKIEKENFYEALQELSINSNERISIHHMQSFIISDECFNIDFLNKTIDVFKSSPWDYPEFKIFLTKNEIEEIYKVENAEAISPYFSLIGEFDVDKNYNYTFYTTLATSLYEKHFIPYITMLSAKSNIWQKNSKEITSLYLNGYAFLSDDENKLYLTTEEYPIINILLKKKKITLKYNGIIFHISDSSFSSRFKDEKIVLNAKGSVQVANVPSYYKNEYKAIFTEAVKKDLQALIDLSIEKNVDIFNANDLLYRHKKIDSTNFKSAVYDIKCDYEFIF